LSVFSAWSAPGAGAAPGSHVATPAASAKTATTATVPTPATITVTAPAETEIKTETAALDEALPVRGLAIAAPTRDGMDLFVKFIEQELAPAHFNLLILRVDWNYAYKSHPELSDPDPLTEADVKRLVDVCRRHGIRIAPQINLLGHQSWAETTYALLREYPQFDETPHVDTKNYTEWPNADGLYCKSYCPLHPDMPRVVNALIDEITTVFETDLFHAGMDEVFYIADERCPRCAGHDPAELFAGEVTRISNHLALTGKRLMIWGDRLLDGEATGMGMWEASMNGTARAVDLIPRDVFVCDWHYERADLSAIYLAMKGLDVATCPWRNPELAVRQMNDIIGWRRQTTEATKAHLRGIIETVWSDAEQFLREYYALESEAGGQGETEELGKPNEQGEAGEAGEVGEAGEPESDGYSNAATLKRLMEEFRRL
jgi:hypothetical protein